MSCPVCGESRYWSPADGCLICNRKMNSPRFVLTLSDDEFAKLSDRSQHLDELLVLPLGQYARVIIQRAAD